MEKVAKAIKTTDQQKGTHKSLSEYPNDNPPKYGRNRRKKTQNNNEKDDKWGRHIVKNLLESKTIDRRQKPTGVTTHQSQKVGISLKTRRKPRKKHIGIIWKLLPSQSRQARLNKVDRRNQGNNKKTSWIHGDEQTNIWHNSKINHRSNQETKNGKAMGTLVKGETIRHTGNLFKTKIDKEAQTE